MPPRYPPLPADEPSWNLPAAGAPARAGLLAAAGAALAFLNFAPGPRRHAPLPREDATEAVLLSVFAAI